MDLSQLSTEDLMALKAGDIGKVSTPGLQMLKTGKVRDQIDADPISMGAKNFMADDSFGSNVLTGIGRGMASVGRALSFQSPEQTAEAKRIDAPLMNTGGGKLGNVVGQAALAAPVAFVPGANTVLGASIGGAALGGLTTEGDAGERLMGAGLGAAGGMAGVALGKGAGLVADKLKASRAAAQVANAGKDAAAASAQKAGYVLPPTEVNPGLVNSALEGLSGKIKTSQKASQQNQTVTNKLAQDELGLTGPIGKDDLAGIRSKAGQAYDAVSNAGVISPTPAYEAALDKLVAPAMQAAKGFPNAKANPIIAEIESLRSPQFDAASAVSKIKELRASADTAYIQGNKDLGKALKGGADALEGAIDTHLVQTGAAPDILQNFRDARQTIAKTYSVEKALNPQTGDVSAQALAKQLEKGRPLSGNLLRIAETGQAFPKATQALKQNYNATSPLDWAMGAFGAGSGNPLLAMSMAARPAVRSALLSGAGQKMAGRPNYGSNALLEMMRDSRALPVAGMAPARQ